MSLHENSVSVTSVIFIALLPICRAGRYHAPRVTASPASRSQELQVAVESPTTSRDAGGCRESYRLRGGWWPRGVVDRRRAEARRAPGRGADQEHRDRGELRRPALWPG